MQFRNLEFLKLRLIDQFYDSVFERFLLLQRELLLIGDLGLQEFYLLALLSDRSFHFIEILLQAFIDRDQVTDLNNHTPILVFPENVELLQKRRKVIAPLLHIVDESVN